MLLTGRRVADKSKRTRSERRKTQKDPSLQESPCSAKECRGTSGTALVSEGRIKKNAYGWKL